MEDTTTDTSQVPDFTSEVTPPSDSSSDTTEEINSPTTDPSVDISSSPTVPLPNSPTPPTSQLEDDNNSKEEMWMIIAIVFITLFGVALLFFIYRFVLTKLRATRMNRNVHSSAPNAFGPTTTSIGSSIASKLPRLYVDRMRDRPLITAQHKKV